MTVWGVHMDISVGTVPVERGYVAIGWPEVGDLAAVGRSREDFRNAIRKSYPTAKPGSIPVQAGVLYRFVHEISTADVVIYPSKVDRMVNIGRFVGEYRYLPEDSTAYPNQRQVEWLRHVPRDDLSQAALYEIGSFISLFRVQNNASEFMKYLDSSQAVTSDAPTADQDHDDETVTQAVSAQAEETTFDFIIRQLKAGLTPFQFEHFISHLLTCMGYHTRLTTRSGDGGVDVIAHRDELGFEPPIIKVQCKQVTSPIGRPEVTQLLGNVERGEHGLFVTLGSFTREAREYDRGKPQLRLIDGEQLVELIFNHYKNFEPKYQALLPLKSIYVPSLGSTE